MALNEDNQRWVLERIQETINPNGWRKVADKLRYWGLLGVVITAFLALIAIAITLGVFATNRISQESEFRGRTDTRLANIESDLRDIKGQLTKQSLATHAAMPAAQFKSTLPDLGSSLSAALTQDLKVPPAVLNDLAQKMTEVDKNAPGLWPATAELISYRSFSTASQEAKKLLTGELPNCTDSLPKPMTVAEVLSSKSARLNRAIYENCRFTLDSPDQDEKLNKILNTSSPLLTFKNCAIEYHGGEINLILAWNKMPVVMTMVGRGPEDPDKVMQVTLTGASVQFEECLFYFSFTATPPLRGQQLSTSLLAQNTSSVALPVAR